MLLHKEAIYDLYHSANIIRMIKSRRMKWEGHGARMEAKNDACRVWVGKPEGKGLPERHGANVRIILKLNLKIGLGRGPK
jgi:hypothetical protein